ncbi:MULTISPECIES: MFS transporter [Methylobacterium]|uniref:MFS transporter n=1 Tax=Methylobacterium longum TaxID=767694 RepID=A0ABT8AK51_9HYPH|nr:MULTISPECIES: MFS transporter [Methylobacterium]MCJ2102849.1 MFS transporter [Methylobacterium sp. E-046]MDN3570201.1 MFS transporter [Methylobacterium longum]GJE13414.1 putative MFS-type transporter [Methylobacterium longum]
MQPAASLGALNFALAGAREGFGPFLGVYLQKQGFDPAATGFAMGLAGFAGLLATTPVGALIDRTAYKRAALAAAVLAIAMGAVGLVSTNSLWLIGLSQLLIGVADTSIAPLVAAVTLGIVGQKAYGHRVSRNEAFNHAGNAANAALSGVLGYTLGLGYVSIAIVVMAVASCGVLFTIDKGSIDHGTARGGAQDERSTLRVLFGTKPLLILAGTVFAYQTANGAMLPFLAQARTAAGADPSLTTGVMTVVAQATMVGAALLAARVAKGHGHANVLSIALGLVVARGILAAFATSWLLVIPVQILEGLAMGLGGVAIPALVAEMMEGTGHANAGLGGVMTAYGAGATVSPLLAGLVAQYLGFAASFLALASVAGAGLLVWMVGRRFLGKEQHTGHTEEASAEPV